jgi:hypothetical protein
MADNAPFSVNRPPFPNVVVGFNRRVECHIATFDVATGTPVVDTAKSTAGITVANGAAGVYVLGFPAGGTDAIGWSVVAAPFQATAAGFTFSVASATSSYATGALDLRAFQATDGAAADLTGEVTVMIYVVKAAS